MSEQSNDKKNLDQDVDLSRRKLAKMSVAVPVITTLASKPVFGAQCLSQMMSGNMSQQGPGSCVYGWSPGGWKSANGTVAGYHPSIDAWPAALADDGFSTRITAYGEKGAGPFPSCSSYTGGAPFNAIFGGSDETPMRQILCEESSATVNGAKKMHWIAAYLNSKVVVGYILTTQQVLDFWDDPTPPPGYLTLTDFFDDTWNGGAHGSV